MNGHKIILGVDIGGSHITCAKVDLNVNRIIEGTKNTAEVNSAGSSNEILDIWNKTIKDSFGRGDRPSAIGVAMPGPFDYEEGICKINGVGKYDSLYDINIKNSFSEAAGIETDKIKFLNDAACYALGEYYAGARKGYGRMIAITLGTGFGSSLIIDGNIVSTGKGVPEGGMYWNVPFKESIADDYFSTRWFEESYFIKTGSRKKGVYEIAQSAETDENAHKVFDEFSQNLIEFILPWIEKFEPGILVAGGSISKSHYLFLPSLQREVFKKGIKTEIRISELWEDAAVIGSANLFNNNS